MNKWCMCMMETTGILRGQPKSVRTLKDCFNHIGAGQNPEMSYHSGTQMQRAVVIMDWHWSVTVARESYQAIGLVPCCTVCEFANGTWPVYCFWTCAPNAASPVMGTTRSYTLTTSPLDNSGTPASVAVTAGIAAAIVVFNADVTAAVATIFADVAWPPVTLVRPGRIFQCNLHHLECLVLKLGPDLQMDVRHFTCYPTTLGVLWQD